MQGTSREEQTAARFEDEDGDGGDDCVYGDLDAGDNGNDNYYDGDGGNDDKSNDGAN